MALDFDKEMDFLLRNTARKGDFLSGKDLTDNHLDADDLAAFSENALPQTTRTAYVAHLADCDSCRTILSNFILMNEDAEESSASVTASENIVVSEKQTWGEWVGGLFSLPTLGYATAALAVLFIGTFAYINFQGNKSSQVAVVQPAEVGQAEQRPQRQNPAPAPTQAEEQEVAAAEPTPEDVNANTMVAIDTSPTPNASSGDNLPPSVRATRGEASNNRTAAPADTTLARNNQANNSVAAGNTAAPAVVQATPAAESRDEAKIAVDDVAKKREEQAKDAKADSLERDKESVAVTSAPPTSVADINTARRSAKPAAAPSATGQMREPVLPPRTVGGKTFRKRGSVWIDSAYGSQAITNVSRGSDEYKKLDAAVRSIADNFRGETVIIVSQGKAYRIR